MPTPPPKMPPEDVLLVDPKVLPPVVPPPNSEFVFWLEETPNVPGVLLGWKSVDDTFGPPNPLEVLFVDPKPLVPNPPPVVAVLLPKSAPPVDAGAPKGFAVPKLALVEPKPVKSYVSEGF